MNTSKSASPNSLRAFIVLGIAMLAAAFWAAPAAAVPQGPWVLPPAQFPVLGDYDGDSSVAFAPDGSATAIWSVYDETEEVNYIVTATRPPGGSFGAPVPISAESSDVRDPEIAIGPDGSATAVWQFTDTDVSIQASTRPPGGSFGTPVDISTPGLFAQKAQVAIGPDGKATVVWAEIESTNYMISTATGTSTSGFSEPVNLSETGQTNEDPQIAIGADGTAVAVWERWNGATYRIQAATREPNGSFVPAVDISTDGDSTEDPEVTVDPSGQATAVWRYYTGSEWAIQQSSRPAGGEFTEPADVSSPGLDSFEPRVAAGADGTEALTWEGQSENIAGFIAQVSIRPPSGGFGQPVDLSTAGTGASSHGAAVGADGTVTALWSQNGDDGVLATATRPPGGSFGAPTELAPLEESVYRAEVAIGPLNEAIAVWDLELEDYGVRSSSTQLPSLPVDVTKSGTGAGGSKVTSAASGIDCGTACGAAFPAYSKVTLTATPVTGGTFDGWSGDCAGANGNTCDLLMTGPRAAGAAFTAAPTPPGKASLKIVRFAPKRPAVKPGKVAKIKVTAKNTGTGPAASVKLCAKLTKAVKKALKTKGKACFGLGTLAAGKSATKTFKFRATAKAKRGKAYKVGFTLGAGGVKGVKGSVKVKVKRG